MNLFLLLLLFDGVICVERTLSEQNYVNSFNLMQELHNNSSTTIEYIARVYTIFCPDKPICSLGGFLEAGDLRRLIPQHIEIDNDTVNISDLAQTLGICCLPCSCSPSCLGKGNCCPTKQSTQENKNTHKTHLTHKCIQPNVRMYLGKKRDTTSGWKRYFMITQCFENTTDDTIVEKCENPSAYNIDEIGPVTSRSTGRTYWNRYCADCNEDAEHLVDWQAIITIVGGFAFFTDRSRPFPATLEALHRNIVLTGTADYNPPMSLENETCIPETLAMSCNMQPDTMITSYTRSVYELCDSFYHPVYQTNAGKVNVFRNIFCLFCSKTEFMRTPGATCDLGKAKYTLMRTTALLDYKSQHHVSRESGASTKDRRCRCDEVYDIHEETCRPVFCPVGDLLIACNCEQPLKNLSGMPVLMIVKVVPVSGQLNLEPEQQLNKYHKALKKRLQNTVTHTTANVIATYKVDTDVEKYYISAVIVKSDYGHDTKTTMKSFMTYLDSKEQLKIICCGFSYTVHLTSRVSLSPLGGSSLLYNIRVLDALDIEPSLLFSTGESIRVLQRFSPLFYCMQVELEANEFEENEGIITVNTTAEAFNVSYYYWVTPTEIRVCVDDYYRHPLNCEAKHGICCLLVCLMKLFSTLLAYCFNNCM